MIRDFVIPVFVDALVHPRQPFIAALLPLDKRLEPTVRQLPDEIGEEGDERVQPLVVVEDLRDQLPVFVFLGFLADGIGPTRPKVVGRLAHDLLDVLVGHFLVTLVQGKASLHSPRLHLEEECVEELQRPGHMPPDGARPLH